MFHTENPQRRALMDSKLSTSHRIWMIHFSISASVLRCVTLFALFIEHIPYFYLCFSQSSPLPVIESTSQSSNEAPSTSQRNRKRNNADDFGDFLKQMSSIAEKRFCSKLDDAPKVTDNHQGFILMVQDLFSKLDEEAVDDSKIFFINYLHSRIKEYNDI